MARTCLVCNHNKLNEINKSLIDNETNREIAKRFALSSAAVYRHRTNHLPPLLLKARQAGEIVEATSLMDRVERIMTRCETIAETATRTKDWFPAIAASRELRGCLELLGKLSGEIQSGTQVGIQIINGRPAKMVAIGSDEWRSSMIQFLDEVIAESDPASR